VLPSVHDGGRQRDKVVVPAGLTGGTKVLALNADDVSTIYRIDNGSAEPVRGLQAGEQPVRWTEDGHGLLVAKGLERDSNASQPDDF
jgi:hypothetical protein